MTLYKQHKLSRDVIYYGNQELSILALPKKLKDEIMSDGSIKTQTVYQISPATSRRTTSRIYPVGALDIFSGDIFRFRVISPFPSLL